MNVKVTPSIQFFLLFFVIFSVGIPLFSSHAATTYVGSKNSDVYHYPSCHYVDNIKPENLVYFSSPEEAIAAGYRPCKVCSPPTSSGGGDGGGTSKSSSTITCTLSASNVIMGEPVIVSGSINPSRAHASARLLFTTPTSSLIERTTTTDSSGHYTYSYNANTPGTWSVVADWSGDVEYYGAESPTRRFTMWSTSQPTAIEVDHTATCTSIVDGDSFHSTYGEVRLADLDCPELGDSGYTEARNALTALILNQPLLLDVDDISETDQYDRYVCLVYVNYNTTHVVNVNHYMVYHHYAVIDDYTNNEFSPYTWQAYAPKPSKQVSCTVWPSQITTNESITISGIITPSDDAETVTLLFTMPDSTVFERDVIALSDGSYTDEYTPQMMGSWTVTAEVSGDQLYGSGSSVARSFHVTKLFSDVTCYATAPSIPIGDSVTLSGVLTPHYAEEIITIEQRRDAAWSQLTSVTTNLDGSYEFNWTPPISDNYYLKAIWTGDDEYGETSSVVVALIVTKLSCSLTCDTTTTTVVIGEHVVLSGIIDPVRSDVDVTIEQQTNSGWIMLNTVSTDADGKFSYVWTPSTAGTFPLRASIASDDTYSASTSSSQVVSVEKITPSLSCAVSSSEITFEDSVTISGDIDPTQEGVSIEIHCTINGQDITIATVTIDSTGRYTHQWTPSATGTYQIAAVTPSTEQYYEATSSSVLLTVNSQPVSQRMILAPILGIAFVGIFFYQWSRRARS